MMNKFALISILSLFTTTFEAVNGQGKYFSYCTTDFTRGCDVYDPDTVSLKGSPTEIEIRCYNSGENFCLEVKEVVQPFPFAETCTEESGCLCPEGNCEMPNCKSDCDCAGGFCDMPKCTSNCDCDGGFCSMPTCGAECFCADGGCDIPSCCGGTCECGRVGCNLRNSVNTVDLPGVKSCFPFVYLWSLVGLLPLFALLWWWRKKHMAHRKLHPRVPGFGCFGIRIMTTRRVNKLGHGGNGGGAYVSPEQKSAADFMDQMKYMSDLKDKGYLTDEEFMQAKRKVMNVESAKTIE